MQFKLNPLSYLDLHIFFFFNDPPTTEIYTLSLHDALPIFVKYCATWLGRSRIEIAKMIGMTPALLTRSGMCVLPPEYIRVARMRFAYCTGTLRWPSWMKMIAAITRTAMTAIDASANRFCCTSKVC